MALFDGTRGLFVGWLKGVMMLAVAPLFAVLAGTMMLELAVPVITALSAVPGKIDARAAMAFFMIGAVHIALMIMVLKVAGTMVSGLTVFGLARSHGADRGGASRAGSRAAPSAAQIQAAVPQSGGSSSPATSRQIRVASAMPIAANDLGSSGASTTSRTARLISSDRPDAGGGGRPQVSRARGIGSRFRAAPHPSSSRSTEKKR